MITINVKLRELLQSKDIPVHLQPKYVLSWIGGEDIILSWRQREGILKAIDEGIKYVNIRDEHTVMVSSVRGISPYWGEPNIPRRPVLSEYESACGKIDNDLTKEWDIYFKDFVNDLKLGTSSYALRGS